MLNTAVKQNTLLLEDTIGMLQDLDEDELKTLQAVIKVFLAKDKDDNFDELVKDYYKPLTEAELIERIDCGIAEADAGLGTDAFQFSRELRLEFGL